MVNTKIHWKEKKQIKIDRTAVLKLSMSIIIQIVLISLIMISSSNIISAVPTGPNITYSINQTLTVQQAANITTQGGSFTTLSLNVTQQTSRWKAYVGNITGKLTLADSTAKSVFDWTLSSVTGEVYITRNNSIDWSTIACADDTTISDEQTALNISAQSPDSINNTFNNSVHRSFYVGTTNITSSSCYAIATYVNGVAQASSENAAFQEILLQDSTSKLVYAAIISNNNIGYNNQMFDFQTIVPENEFQSSATTYYIYVELA